MYIFPPTSLQLRDHSHVVRVTNLVFFNRGREDYSEKKIQPLPKNSSTIPGSWMVPGPRGMILGQGGVVRDSLGALEDGCDLFESCAALKPHPGATSV